MESLLWSTYLKLTGWKIVGQFPEKLKKAIIVAGPHTSNWDFPLGLASRSIGKIPANFMIKDSWTNLPIVGKVILGLGGVPVDRSGTKKISMTQATIDAVNNNDEFILCIAPEGTRKYQPKLKTGFWHIADETGIPMVPISFDYPSKTIYWAEPIYSSGDKEADLKKIRNILSQYKGKFPEQGIKPIEQLDNLT